MMEATSSSTNFRVLTSLADCESYANEYRALFNASDALPYCCYEWLHAFIKYKAPREEFFICIAEDAQGPFAAIPLVARKQSMIRWLELFADGPATHNTGLILDRGRHINLVKLACSWIQTHYLKWDYCSVSRLAEGSGLYLNADPGSNEIVTALPSEPFLAIDLPGSWEDYLANVNRKLRNNIGRNIRRLEAAHETRMARAGLTAGDTTAIESVTEDALSVCRRSWQSTAAHGSAISDPDTVDFFRQSSLALAREGMLDLAVLYADENPVAFSWGVARNGIACRSAFGFDAEMAKLGPGMVLDALMIKDSIERGMTEFHLGSEFPEYKQRWCNRNIPQYEVLKYARPGISKLKHRIQMRWNRSIGSRRIREACLGF